MFRNKKKLGKSYRSSVFGRHVIFPLEAEFIHILYIKLYIYVYIYYIQYIRNSHLHVSKQFEVKCHIKGRLLNTENASIKLF